MNNETLRYQQFHEVFQKYYASLCNYAYSVLNDLNIAEDIVQDSFVKIWDKKKDLVGADNIRFYLFSVVRNGSLTHLSNQRKKRFEALPEEYQMADISSTSASEKEDTKELQQLINEALQLLPPKCREVFMLCRISRLSYLEVAAILGISVKTVENHMGKALKIIRQFARENKQYFLLLIIFFIRE